MFPPLSSAEVSFKRYYNIYTSPVKLNKRKIHFYSEWRKKKWEWLDAAITAEMSH